MRAGRRSTASSDVRISMRPMTISIGAAATAAGDSCAKRSLLDGGDCRGDAMICCVGAICGALGGATSCVRTSRRSCTPETISGAIVRGGTGDCASTAADAGVRGVAASCALALLASIAEMARSRRGEACGGGATGAGVSSAGARRIAFGLIGASTSPCIDASDTAATCTKGASALARPGTETPLSTSADTAGVGCGSGSCGASNRDASRGRIAAGASARRARRVRKSGVPVFTRSPSRDNVRAAPASAKECRALPSRSDLPARERRRACAEPRHRTRPTETRRG